MQPSRIDKTYSEMQSATAMNTYLVDEHLPWAFIRVLFVVTTAVLTYGTYTEYLVDENCRRRQSSHAFGLGGQGRPVHCTFDPSADRRNLAAEQRSPRIITLERSVAGCKAVDTRQRGINPAKDLQQPGELVEDEVQ